MPLNRLSPQVPISSQSLSTKAPLDIVSWCEEIWSCSGCRFEVDVLPGVLIPSTGPLVVIANLSFGILDLCALGRYLSKVRTDLRVAGPSFLVGGDSGLPWFIPTDDTEPRLNEEAVAHLRAGGVLVVFPSYEVGRWQFGQRIVESEWMLSVAGWVRECGAPVLPVYISGKNSAIVQTLSSVKRKLNRALTRATAYRRRTRSLRLQIGDVLAFTKLRKFDDLAMTRYLRLRTLILSGRQVHASSRMECVHETTAVTSFEDQTAIWREVENVRVSGGALITVGNLSAMVANAMQIPQLLQEIGRQREITFRQVGEGTGNEIDLDRFDEYYLHLFLWDDKARRLVGAYRIGLADQILAEHGKRGLYTSTLFKFRDAFLTHLSDAVEMGRSFIVSDYQRTPTTLPLLWKGISIWMSRNPHYRKLFGPVSISRDYHHLSKNMLIEFLKDNRLNAELASQVKPRQPYKVDAKQQLMREFVSASLRDIEDCAGLISSLETDQKGVPILLKHYLRLNGTLISFNVDKAFSSVVDGLIMVDLTRTDPRLLARYMGEDACNAYLAIHGKGGDSLLDESIAS